MTATELNHSNLVAAILVLCQKISMDGSQTSTSRPLQCLKITLPNFFLTFYQLTVVKCTTLLIQTLISIQSQSRKRYPLFQLFPLPSSLCSLNFFVLIQSSLSQNKSKSKGNWIVLPLPIMLTSPFPQEI